MDSLLSIIRFYYNPLKYPINSFHYLSPLLVKYSLNSLLLLEVFSYLKFKKINFIKIILKIKYNLYIY